MAGGSISVYKSGSVARGQHVYKRVWLTKHVSASCGKTEGRQKT